MPRCRERLTDSPTFTQHVAVFSRPTIARRCTFLKTLLTGFRPWWMTVKTLTRCLSSTLRSMAEEFDGMTAPLEFSGSLQRESYPTETGVIPIPFCKGIAVKRQGKTAVGYGAPGKGNTVLNYCGSVALSLIRSWVAPRKKQGALFAGRSWGRWPMSLRGRRARSAHRRGENVPMMLTRRAPNSAGVKRANFLLGLERHFG
jgi:hypothetical protein